MGVVAMVSPRSAAGWIPRPAGKSELVRRGPSITHTEATSGRPDGSRRRADGRWYGGGNASRKFVEERAEDEDERRAMTW